MKASEFYEKYVTINGKPTKKLNDAEKEFLDNAAEQPNCEQVIFLRGRKGNLYIGIQYLKEQVSIKPTKTKFLIILPVVWEK